VASQGATLRGSAFKIPARRCVITHAALGETSQALRAFRRFADRMREELDAGPDDDTTAFFERLQQGTGV